MKVWIVAAGTGGHIFPGIFLARELMRLVPDLKCEFFGNRNRLEAELIPKWNFPIHFLRSSPMKGLGLWLKVRALLDLVVGFFQALMKLREGRPIAVVSVGGFVSAPVVLVGALFRIPIFIIEPNIRSGFSNRWLSHFARSGFSVPGSDAIGKLHCPTMDWGVPVREGLRGYQARNSKRVLILGGSQGARTLCQWLCQIWADPQSLNWADQWTLQCGRAHVAQVRGEVEKLGLDPQRVRVTDFIHDVPQALADADFVIARAGALTIAELAAIGMPTLFVPFPHAADNHQEVNAQLLVDSGSAWMAKESEPDAFLKFQLRLKALLSLGSEDRESLSRRFSNWGRPEAGRRIAEMVLSSVSKSD
jgi:UDP-N-acetylglucosamine--N-acetylmuramyl-(pentapeptide) pyrophosphoryl-undecaprenol N-acetylglucosamine transferase